MQKKIQFYVPSGVVVLSYCMGSQEASLPHDYLLSLTILCRSSSGPSDKELLSPYSLFMNDTSYRLQNSGEKMHSLNPEHIFINIHIHMSHEQPARPH